MHTSHPIFTLVWRPPPDCAICFVLILYPSLYCPLRDPCRRVNRKALGLKFVCLLFFFFFFAFFLFLFSTHFPPGTSFMICLGNARLSSPSKCLLYVKFVFFFGISCRKWSDTQSTLKWKKFFFNMVCGTVWPFRIYFEILYFLKPE